MVSPLIAGAVKLVPVPMAVPPVAWVNQLMVPPDVVACNVGAPMSHTKDGLVTVTTGMGFMVAITAVRLAVVQLTSYADA